MLNIARYMQILELLLFQVLFFLARYYSTVIFRICYWLNTQLFLGGYIGSL